MGDEKPLKLGAERGWGETTCGYGLTAEAECDRPAVWHLYWLVEGHGSAACGEHLNYINSRPHPEYDIHPFSGECGMPGVQWHFTTDDTESWCAFPGPADASTLVEHADEPLLIGDSRG